jgi:hypothetical protein
MDDSSSSSDEDYSSSSSDGDYSSSSSSSEEDYDSDYDFDHVWWPGHGLPPLGEELNFDLPPQPEPSGWFYKSCRAGFNAGAAFLWFFVCYKISEALKRKAEEYRKKAEEDNKKKEASKNPPQDSAETPLEEENPPSSTPLLNEDI